MVYFLLFLLSLLFTPIVNTGEHEIGILTHLMKSLSIHDPLHDKEFQAPCDKELQNPWDRKSFKAYRDPLLRHQEDWELDQCSRPASPDYGLAEPSSPRPTAEIYPTTRLSKDPPPKPAKYTILDIAISKIISLFSPLFSRKGQEKEQTVLKIGNIEVGDNDLRTLNPKEYINDAILNACFEMMRENHIQLHLRTSQNTPTTIAIVDTQFFLKIQSAGTLNRQCYHRWLRKKGLYIEELEYLVIPANTGNHWFTAVINIPEDRIEIYNSLPGYSVKKEVNQITDWWLWYSMEFDDIDLDISSCTVNYHHEIRQAMGSNDCGIATVMVAACIAHNLPPTKTMLNRGLNQQGLGKGRTEIKRAIQENAIRHLSVLRPAN